MMKTGLAVLALAVIALAGCKNGDRAAKYETLAKQAVANKMKDPASVQWRHVRTNIFSETTESMAFVCGEMNAKNGYGAYDGFESFVVHMHDEQSVGLIFIGSAIDPDVAALCPPIRDQ
jgi:hypothetical protein